MSDNDIAIIGMAARLPGARTVRAYWQNLREGVESVRALSEAELLESGVGRDALRDPHYVRAAAPLEKMEWFDAEFFGFSPKEAAIMDPQHRQFLEACWEALEDAAHPPETFDGAVGVFAGCGMGSYFAFNLLTNPELVKSVGLFLLRHTGNDKDFLATRASYLLNLRGPSINVQTACSTSLVAVHMAAQHLLSGECDMALAGGVTIEIPHRRGYRYEEGEILSPDGHCRAFDHRSKGTVFGSGAGVVVLRRLSDALADGDAIYAVLKGTAVNNDGSQKVGYLAPSVDGQAACIAEAIAVSGVDAESIGYVECHGTGTPMGDPIEVAALTQAFRESTEKRGFCGIGSVKTNIGHLDTAAGVAALMKASLAVQHGEIPPSLNFEKNNPSIDFASSPFFVNDALRPWSGVRRAGVNSLGVGGTNAFAIVEEPPRRAASTASAAKREPFRLLCVSGRTRAAVDENCAQLARFLKENPDVDLGDVAWTLQVGRRAFAERRVVAARTVAEAAELLGRLDPKRVFHHTAGEQGDKQSVAFLFPGGGAQYARMGKDLYDAEPLFRKIVDDGIAKLQQKHGVDLRPLWFCDDDEAALAKANAALEKPSLQLPAIFILEYALAQLLMSWDLKPTALLGHSLGENTAACVAGTMTFDECLGLVALRGRLMDRVAGAMVVVPLPPAELQPLLDELGLDLATVNAPELCVASGSAEGIARLEARLAERAVEVTRVKINIAAHSRLLDPILDEFRAYLATMKLSAPKIPWVSNRTGTWVTHEQATSPRYWVEHLRNAVLFAEGVATLAAERGRVFIEVGPGKTLSSLARMHPVVKPSQVSLPALRHPEDKIDDVCMLLTLRGRLWAAGGALDTAKLFAGEKRLRVRLPTYAFQSQRYFIEPGTRAAAAPASAVIDKEPDVARWFWQDAWKRRDAEDAVPGKLAWLVFLDETGVGRRVVERLRQRGDSVVIVRAGDSYERIADDEYRLAPEHGRGGYDSLVADLVRTGRVPDRVAHLALLADEERFRPGSSFFHRNQERGFYSLFFFAQAWAAEGIKRPLHIAVATCGMQRVKDDDDVRWPEQATVLGPARVIPRELPGVTVATIDVDVRDLVRTKSARERAAELLETLGALAARGSALQQARTRVANGGVVARAVTDGDGPFAGAAGSARVRPSEAADVASALAVLGKRGARLIGPERVSDDDIVAALEAELTAPAASAVVAHRHGRRYVQELSRVELPPLAPSEGSERLAGLRERGVVLVTGGLGGIGLAVARELVDAKKARLALLSRTPLPPREEWPAAKKKLGADHPTARRIAAVEDLEARGAEVLVVAGDVTDVERLRAALAAVRARFGAIHGVVHAAGVVNDGLLLQKTQSDVEDVLAPKVYGTIALDNATKDDDLDLFVAFSSTSTATAPPGQTDYVAANAFLTSFAHARARRVAAAGRGGRTLALHWGTWNEVGMAAAAAKQMRGVPQQALDAVPCKHPFFDMRSTDAHGVTELRARYAPDTSWLFDDHRTRDGQALLPGAAYLELARAALAELDFDRPFEMRDLTFFRPLAADDGATVEVRFRLRPSEQGYVMETQEQVELPAATAEGATAPGRKAWRRTAQVMLWLHEQPAQPRVDVDAIEAECPRAGPLKSGQEQHLRFGPRWRVVQRVLTADRVAVAHLALADAHAADLEHVKLHPALVDLGTGFAMHLIDGYDGDTLWVPVSYAAVRVWSALPQRLRAVARVREGSSQAAGFARFDVQLVDEQGRVCMEVSELTIKRLEGALDLGRGRRVLPAEVELEPAPRGDRDLSPAELAFQHALEQGILPDEGARAFGWALSSWTRPQLYVSSLDLAALVAQTDAAAAPKATPAGGDGNAVFARPQLSSTYVEPRDDVERTLVELWQELLGVSQVGVQDDFFQLGGHSLVAVRLFAKVKKAFAVDFPMSVLFEAPTIEACANLIRAAVPGAGGSNDDVDAAGHSVGHARPAASRPRYTHLVPMHPADGGTRTPFFLVAGMFGNVLNLRHLANQIGSDRPFYGLQARGLFGNEKPHETFEEMARDYLAEMRLVQPHGPYLLGGFSGGGIAALEIARQLREAGDEAALVVLLDTPIPQDETLTRADKLQMHLQSLKREGSRYLTERVKSRIEWEIARRTKREHTEDNAGATFHSVEIEAAFYRALARYTVRHHPGALTLFRPKLQPVHVFGPNRQINKDRRFIYDDNGWSRFCDRVDVTEVPGDHDSMVLEPNVRVLAARMRERILDAERRIRTAATAHAAE